MCAENTALVKGIRGGLIAFVLRRGYSEEYLVFLLLWFSIDDASGENARFIGREV